LCTNPIAVGTINWDKTDVYFFGKDKVYVLNGRTNGDDPKSSSGDKLFQNIRLSSVEPTKKWKGFDVNYGQFFAADNTLCAIKDNQKYKCWDTSGQPIGKEETIGEAVEEMKDKQLGGDTNPVALVDSDGITGNYELIANGKAVPMAVEDGKLEALPVPKDGPKYPDYLISVLKTSENNWYYIKNDGTYCKKLDLSNKEVGVHTSRSPVFFVDLETGLIMSFVCLPTSSSLILIGNSCTSKYVFTCLSLHPVPPVSHCDTK
jgi:hypothetical protein